MKVDLILSSSNPYSYERYTAAQLKGALTRMGVLATIHDLQDFSKSLIDLQNGCDLLVSFSYRAPRLSLLASAPQVYWERRSLDFSFPQIKEEEIWLASFDRQSEASERCFFLPHACDLSQISLSAERPFSLVMLEALDEGKRETLSHVECLRMFPIHLFGDHRGTNLLRKYSHTFLHPSLPESENFNLLSQTTILLRSRPTSIDGSDEWVFEALARGALPLIPPTRYLQEVFGKNAPIFFTSIDELKEKISEYLQNVSKRGRALEEMQSKLFSESFEKRAETLLNRFL